ncbi:hypothetical protein DEW08_22770 (plasmid) [Azospirillum thermophilum]|uniref:Uncharacterized protein n=2 Tax=Azospirillum thermophilum TaxID=2202148 RepID=A0A2S2CWI2_9PROT|nr:hypothetical protein [Azospirillum thermophilum]AWK88884.1 hypothetical protein DEW08_22770 [Azospirillum thermophilum]
MRMGYTGWALPEEERARLLTLVPARYERLIAHHVTREYNVPEGHPLPAATAGDVVGVVDDGEGVQALIVEIDGTTDRPDGSTNHITWSLGPGRQPVESNSVIAGYGWRPVEPVTIRLEPRFFPL